MLLSVFTGCSLYSPNKNKGKDDIVLVVGEDKITREELSQLYYTFYSQNSSYFYYYEDEQIADIFYQSVVASKLTLQEAKKLIANNVLVITDKDYEHIWEHVFEYFYGQVDTAEKAILTSKGAENDDLPKRLQTEESSDEKAYKYAPYEFEEVKFEPATGTSATAPSVDSKLADLKLHLFKYNTSKDEENPVYENIAETELKIRNQAYQQYISSLVLSAKANGKDTNTDNVFKTEVERVYKSYYESELQEKYQEYINSTSANSENNCYSNAIIAKKFKELLNASHESNSVEDNYIEVVTSTSNDSLILYHYEGKYQFFTVQHILVSYEDEILDVLKKVPGYDTSKDKMLRDYYEAYREALIGGPTGIENMETSYRGEDGYVVKDSDGNELKIKISEILSNFETEVADKIAKLESTDLYNAMTEEEKENFVKAVGITASEYQAMNSDEQTLAKQRVRTLLFNQYAWKYSNDTGSLTNDKLAGILGFTITSEQNNHGSLVKDFANGARKMFKEVKNGTTKVGEAVESVVTDYGVHLMMVTGVYEFGEAVSLVGKTDDEVVEELKNTYISNMSTQTLYQYVYDIVKDATVGDNGTFYTNHRNKMIKENTDNGKVEYKTKYTYAQLNELIG